MLAALSTKHGVISDDEVADDGDGHVTKISNSVHSDGSEQIVLLLRIDLNRVCHFLNR